MVRPRKHPAQRKTFDLRIPVTEEQRRTLEQAVALTRDGQFAPWARRVLLLAAEEAINSTEKKARD